MLKIPFENFFETLKDFPDDFEKYCEIRDNITFNKKYGQIDLCCYFCKDKHHLVDVCPLIHKKTYSNFVLEKYLFGPQHISRKNHFVRRYKKSKNPLFFLKDNLKMTLKSEEDDFEEEFEFNEDKYYENYENYENNCEIEIGNDSKKIIGLFYMNFIYKFFYICEKIYYIKLKF